MDFIKPGRGIADVLPEALKAAGAQGVVLNHSERPMTLNALLKTIDRAKTRPIFGKNEMLPSRVNTEFIHIISETEFDMRGWERGSGETLA